MRESKKIEKFVDKTQKKIKTQLQQIMRSVSDLVTLQETPQIFSLWDELRFF